MHPDNGIDTGFQEPRTPSGRAGGPVNRQPAARRGPTLSGRIYRAGFTLIELLVVVSIIAMLISILLPSLKKAREQAKVAVCLANMKGITAASLTYAASDSQENTLAVHPLTGIRGADVGSYDWGGKSGSGEPVGGPLETQSTWGTAQGRGPGTRPLNLTLFKSSFTDYQELPGPNQINWKNDIKLDLGLLRCPSDRGYTGHHFEMWANSSLSSYDHYGTSYAANTLWCAAHLAQCYVKSWGPFLRALSRIPNPANTVYYTENCGRFGWRSNIHSDNPACYTSSDGPHFSKTSDITVVKGWHNRNYEFVVGFVDGHAGKTRMEGHQVPPPRISHYPDGRSAVALCHLIRGPGWQLDALPSPPIYLPTECGFIHWDANTLE